MHANFTYYVRNLLYRMEEVICQCLTANLYGQGDFYVQFFDQIKQDFVIFFIVEHWIQYIYLADVVVPEQHQLLSESLFGAHRLDCIHATAVPAEGAPVATAAKNTECNDRRSEGLQVFPNFAKQDWPVSRRYFAESKALV